MTFRFVAISVTIASFSVTFALSMWHRHSERESYAAELVAPPPAPVHEQIAANMYPVRRIVRPEPAPPAADPIPATEPNSEPPDLSQIEVPARVVLSRDTDQSGRVATLINASSETLDVSITASNPVTGHESFAQVTLGPRGRRNLNEAGLNVEHGDQLTIHSLPYRDHQSRPP